jgi:hypothetical protein
LSAAGKTSSSRRQPTLMGESCRLKRKGPDPEIRPDS